MDIRMRFFIGIIMVLAFVYIVHAIRTSLIDIRHSLVWMAMVIILMILDIFPNILEVLAKGLGFALPVNMLFFLGVFISIVIIFGLTAKVSKLNDQMKTMTQEMALMEKKLEEMDK